MLKGFFAGIALGVAIEFAVSLASKDDAVDGLKLQNSIMEDLLQRYQTKVQKDYNISSDAGPCETLSRAESEWWKRQLSTVELLNE